MIDRGTTARHLDTRTNALDAFTRAEGVEKLQLKIGGMSCSFCVASTTKAMRRMGGVRAANVNLAHEEVLIEYEPAKISPAALKRTLLDLGYTVRDARKARTFEEEDAELRRERNNLLIAAAFTAVALTMMVLMWLGVIVHPTAVPLLPMLMPALDLGEVIAFSGHERQNLLRLAASAESPSEHPLGRAIVAAVEAQELGWPSAEDFQATPGKGVTASVDRHRVLVGSPRFVEETGVALDPAHQPPEAMQAAANTAVPVSIDGRLAGLIAIADQIKPDAREAIVERGFHIASRR